MRSVGGVLLRAAALAFLATGSAGAEGDPARGEILFRHCKACHQIGEGAKHRAGPHLNELVGRVAGGAEEYRYSKAMQAAGEAGLAWTAATLNEFLASPRAMVGGTRMSFRGFSDSADRSDIVAYIAGFTRQTRPPAAEGPALDPAILAIEGDLTWGEYLSGECTTCHRVDGADKGIPPIVHLSHDAFVIALHGYRTKTRTHPVMNTITARLSDEEIAALAAYFTSFTNQGEN